MSVIVLGMHRSGTSAVSCLLERMGIYVGAADELLPSGEDNPDGFWERNDVVRANKKILRQCNCRWDMLSAFRAEKVGRVPRRLLTRRAEAVLAILEPHAPWLIKDPRMCVLLPLWRPVLRNPVCLIVGRHPVEVADSLSRRNGMPLEVGAALWELYMAAAINNSSGLRRLFVSFDRMIGNPVAEASALGASLLAAGCEGIRIPEAGEILSCLGPRPAAPGSGNGAANLTREQQSLWGMLTGGAVPVSGVLVSPRSMRVLESYEKAVVAAMPAGERARRRMRGIARILGLPWDCSGNGQALTRRSGSRPQTFILR